MIQWIKNLFKCKCKVCGEYKSKEEVVQLLFDSICYRCVGLGIEKASRMAELNKELDVQEKLQKR